MKWLCLFLTVTVFACARNTEDDQKAIAQTFNDYKEVIRINDGVNALKYYDSNTHRYFEFILDKIKHADSVEVENLRLIDKFTVLLMRHIAPHERLLQFNTDSMIAYTVESGFAGGKNVELYTLGTPVITGETAIAPILQDSLTTGNNFYFHLENESWKIDISPSTTGSEKVIADQIAPTGKTEHAYIIDILQVITGNPASPTIWRRLE